MKAAVVTRYGAVRHMVLKDLPDPRPEPGTLLVRVRAIGLNFADVMSRLGVYPNTPPVPFVPGLELAGEVEETGEGVTAFSPGDRVIAFAGFGSHAERIVVREERAMRMPDTMSWEEGASTMVTYLTALHALDHLANCREGETVLVHAAAGGVGTASIQLARHFGLTILATAGGEEKVGVALDQGADHAIDYREKEFWNKVKEAAPPDGIDIILDGVGGGLFRPGWNLLSPMGRYVLFGFASVAGRGALNRLKAAFHLMKMVPIHPFSTVSGNRGLMGFNLSLLPNRAELLARGMERILHLYEEGTIQPVVGRTFPFEEIGEAHRALQCRDSVGKVVVTIA